MLYTILGKNISKCNCICIFFLTSESYTQDKYHPTVQDKIYIMAFSLQSEETNLSRKYIGYMYFLCSFEFPFVYIFIYICIYTHF